MTEAIRTIGFVGLGVMGEPMCRNLVNADRWQVLACDLNQEPVARLVKEGAIAADSVEEVTARADLILTCLPGGEQVEALALGDGGIVPRLRAGQAFADMSTSPPALMRRIEAAAPKDTLFADAPVARTRKAAAEGTLLIMVGGSRQAFERIEPVMRHMGSDVVHCGPAGAGQTAKILNNMVLFQNVAALAEAVEMGERSGMEAKALLDVISLGSGNSFALGAHGRKSLVPRDYPERAFSVRYAAKDLGYALDIAEETGVHTPGARHVAVLFDELIEQGLGERYFPVLRQLLSPKR